MDATRRVGWVIVAIQQGARQVVESTRKAEEQSATSEQINRVTSEANHISGERAQAMNYSVKVVDELVALAQGLRRLIGDVGT